MRFYARLPFRNASISSFISLSFQRPISKSLQLKDLSLYPSVTRRSVSQFLSTNPFSHRLLTNPFSLSSTSLLRPSNLGSNHRTMSSTQAAAVQLLKDTPYFYNSSDSLLEALASKCTSFSNVVGLLSFAQLDSFDISLVSLSQWFRSPPKRVMCSLKKEKS